MKRIAASLLIFFIISGCGYVLPPQRTVVVTPHPETKTPPQLDPAQRVEEKIGALTQMLEGGTLSGNDKEMAENLIAAYKSIRRASSHDLTDEEYREFLHSLFNSLCLLDQSYFSQERARAGDYSASANLLNRKRKEILETYLSGDFEGVINYCLEVKRSFGPNALTPEITLLHALSLGKEGRHEEAITIGEEIVGEFEVIPDSVHLRVGLAELQLQRGQRGKAIVAYRKLIDTLDRHREVLQSLHRKIITAPATAGSPEPRSEREGEVQAEGSQGELLQKVAQLSQAHRFAEARDLLGSKRNKMGTGPERDAIENALKNLETAEEKYLEEQVSLISKNKEALESAQKLLEEEKFEQAISRLDEVALMQGESREVRLLKEQVIERLINRERNRAAKIFLAARKAQDPLEKEKRLYSSYEILKKLIEQYPSSHLNSKIKSHMKAVEGELNKLGKAVQ